MTQETKPIACQDGACFFTDATGAEIITYHGMVANDSDMDGAVKARKRFIKEYGDYYRIAGES